MDEPIWIQEDDPVGVTFDTKGYDFYKGVRGVLGLPAEAHLRLVAVKGEERILIKGAADLKGRVAIKSPEEALEFARLLTSIETHYLFPDVRYLEPRASDAEPGVGEYPREYGAHLNLKPAASAREGDGFVVERNLLDAAGALFRATERVGKDGSYSLEKREVVDERPPVAYPLYQ